METKWLKTLLWYWYLRTAFCLVSPTGTPAIWLKSVCWTLLSFFIFCLFSFPFMSLIPSPTLTSPSDPPDTPPPKNITCQEWLSSGISFRHAIWIRTKTTACKLLSLCYQILSAHRLNSCLIINLFLSPKELIWPIGLIKVLWQADLNAHSRWTSSLSFHKYQITVLISNTKFW